MHYGMIKLLLITIFAAAVCRAQEKCYVFFPTTERPQSIQEKMQGALGGITVTVFGRLNDLNAKIEIEPPDAIISKPSLIGQLSEYTIVLNGVRNGRTEETYVVLSIGTPVDAKDIGAETTIGVIDVLGRTGMKSFINQLFPVEPKLKRVTKVEDLLPLLTFNMAAGILVEDIFINYFKNTSQLDFRITPLPSVQSGIIALGVRKNGKAAKITAVLKKADKTICSIFEVDTWK